jgi:xanthine dehydrogenase YagR molybdenum-binding subunit
MGLGQCLTEGARAFGWKEARERPRASGPVRRGVGVAACMWPNPGGPPATAILKLADGSLNLTTGVSDIGTGAKTVLAMVAAEELGIPDRSRSSGLTRRLTPYAQVSGGQRTTINNTLVRAGWSRSGASLEIAAEELKRPSTSCGSRPGTVPVGDRREPSLIPQLKGLQQRILAVGNRHPNPPKLSPGALRRGRSTPAPARSGRGSWPRTTAGA